MNMEFLKKSLLRGVGTGIASRIIYSLVFGMLIRTVAAPRLPGCISFSFIRSSATPEKASGFVSRKSKGFPAAGTEMIYFSPRI